MASRRMKRGRKRMCPVAAGSRLVVDALRKTARKRSLAELTEPACGIFNSGVPDLATSPKHLEGFGRDVRRR